MAQHIYALLVGINTYPSPLSSLQGCVNDVQHLQQYLLAQPKAQTHIRTLLNADATRAAVIDGFQSHLTQAGPDDMALFYFSGHGSQQQAPPEFWADEPDHLNETLVCYDSRLPEGWDLADKELSHLIRVVDRACPHVFVILDCCHSGSGTRDQWPAGVRAAPADERPRPTSSFLMPASRGLSPASAPRHVLFAACRDDQKALEYETGGIVFGAFSYFLLQTLSTLSPDTSTREVFQRTQSALSRRIASQSPQIEAVLSDDLDRVFLGGALTAPSLMVTYERRDGWRVNAGLFYGLSERAVLSLQAVDETGRHSRAVVTHVLPHQSLVRFVEGEGSIDTIYRVMVVHQNRPRLRLTLIGDDATLEPLRILIRDRQIAVEETALTEAHAQVVANTLTSQWTLARIGASTPLMTLPDAEATARALTLFAHFERVRALIHHDASFLGNAPVQIRFTDSLTGMALTLHHESSTPQLILSYDDAEKSPRFEIVVINTSDEVVFAALLLLSDDLSVRNLFPGMTVRLKPEEQVGVSLGGTVDTGMRQSRSLLKLLLCTAPFDASLLESAQYLRRSHMPDVQFEEAWMTSDVDVIVNYTGQANAQPVPALRIFSVMGLLGQPTTAQTPDERRAARLLALTNVPLNRMQQYRGRNLAAVQRLGRMLRLYQHAIHTEIAGKPRQADFLWTQAEQDWEKIQTDRLWPQIAEALQEPDSAISAEDLQRHFVDEVLIAAHLELAKAQLQQAAPNFQRVEVHLTAIKPLIAAPRDWLAVCDPLLRQLAAQAEQAKNYEIALNAVNHILEIESRDVDLQEYAVKQLLATTGQKLTNGKKPHQINLDAELLVNSINMLEDFRKKNPYTIAIYEGIASLRHGYSIRLANQGQLAEALREIQRALTTCPALFEQLLPTMTQLNNTMKAVIQQIGQLQNQMRYNRRMRLTPQGIKMMTQASIGFSSQQAFIKSSEALKISADYKHAQAYTVWRQIGLPADAVLSERLLLLDALNKLMAAKPATRNDVGPQWETIAAENETLKRLDANRICTYIEKRLFETSSTNAPFSITSGVASISPSSFPAIAKTRRIDLEPFGYWFFGGSDLIAKWGLTAAIMILVLSGLLVLKTTSAAAVRETAYGEASDAFNHQDYITAMEQADLFLSNPPLLTQDGRAAQIRTLYAQAFVSWFTQLGDTISPENQHYIDRYRLLMPPTGESTL